MPSQETHLYSWPLAPPFPPWLPLQELRLAMRVKRGVIDWGSSYIARVGAPELLQCTERGCMLCSGQEMVVRDFMAAHLPNEDAGRWVNYMAPSRSACAHGKAWSLWGGWGGRYGGCQGCWLLLQHS